MPAREDEALDTEPALAPPRGPERPGAAAVAPASPGVAYLVLMAPETSPLLGRRFEIGPVTTIGSGGDEDIVIPLEGVVAHQARIELRGSRLWLVPAAGAVMVREGAIGAEVLAQGERALAHGNQVILGRSVLQVIGGLADELYHECIYQLTIRDGLTGVHNRRYFFEALEREIGRARRGAEDLAVILFELDGVEAGDAVLRDVASRLSSAASREETLARCGVDELGLITSGSIEHALERAAELCRALSPEIAISIGVAVLEPGDASGDALMARARAAKRRVAT